MTRTVDRSAGEAHGPQPRLQHAAGFYESPSDLTALLLPMVQDGLDRGDTVAIAAPDAVTATVASVFGARVVVLTHPGGPAGRSGQTVASLRARELAALAGRSGATITVLIAHDSRHDGPDGTFWTELDAATNVAMAHLPLRQTCLFPSFPLHAQVIDGALANHPLLLTHGMLRRNDGYRTAWDVLAATPAPAAMLLGPPHHRQTFDAVTLAEVRTMVERAVRSAGHGCEQVDDAVTAVNEVATNAVEHGRAPATVSVWEAPDEVIIQIDDRGRLHDPLPGLRAPQPHHERGWGLWLARASCSALHLWTDADGTHVRLHPHR